MLGVIARATGAAGGEAPNRPPSAGFVSLAAPPNRPPAAAALGGSQNKAWANDANAYGRKMLEKMGWNKACGPDNIPADLYKHSDLCQTLLRTLLQNSGP